MTPGDAMSRPRKPFTLIAIGLFSLIALLHVFRLFLGWQVTVDGAVIPVWASVVGAIVAVGLAVMLGRESR